MNETFEDHIPTDYERGFIDGMQYERQFSIDKEANCMTQQEQEYLAVRYTATLGEGYKIEHFRTTPQTNAYDSVLKAIDEIRPAARLIQDKPATWWLDEFEKVVRNLKEKNT